MLHANKHYRPIKLCASFLDHSNQTTIRESHITSTPPAIIICAASSLIQHSGTLTVQISSMPGQIVSQGAKHTVQAYPIVVKTHLARLHYRHLSTITCFMHHVGFKIQLVETSRHIFLFRLDSVLRLEPSWCHSHQFSKQDVSQFTFHNNFSLHFKFQIHLMCNLGVFPRDFSFGITALSSKKF